MAYLILFLLLMLPFAEIAMFWAVSDAVGVFAAVALLVLAAVFGSYLIRAQSLAMADRIAAAIHEGQPPEQPLLDSSMLSLAGILFIIPGFLTDILGLIILLPPTRRFLWRAFAYGFRQTWSIKTSTTARPKPDEPGEGPIIDAEYSEVGPQADEKAKTAQATPASSPWRKPQG